MHNLFRADLVRGSSKDKSLYDKISRLVVPGIKKNLSKKLLYHRYIFLDKHRSFCDNKNVPGGGTEPVKSFITYLPAAGIII